MNKNDEKLEEDEIEVSQNHENNPVLGTIQSLFVLLGKEELIKAFYIVKSLISTTLKHSFNSWIESRYPRLLPTIFIL